MSFLFRLVFMILLLMRVSSISAQQKSNETDKIYGSDPLLYNGRYYTFFPPLNTLGNQYLDDGQFDTGSVTLRGVRYSDLILNYDIYNQNLVLKYNNNLGSAGLIVLSDAWLEEFTFKGKNFKLIQTVDTLKRICQVIGTGRSRIFYFWRKDLNLDNFYGAKNHIFSTPRKEMKIGTENHFNLFWNNKSFCSLFGPEKKNEIRNYIRKYNINVKKATDQKMTDLISFCNTLNTQ